MTDRRPFNVNDYVWVRLTDVGRRILHHNHARLFSGARSSAPPPYVPPEEIDGWSKWQLWSLMHEFGAHLHGCDVPFETTIEIEAKP